VHTWTRGSRCRASASRRRGRDAAPFSWDVRSVPRLRPRRRAGLSSWHAGERHPWTSPRRTRAFERTNAFERTEAFAPLEARHSPIEAPDAVERPAHAPTHRPERCRLPGVLARPQPTEAAGKALTCGGLRRGRRSAEAERNERHAPPRLTPSGVAGLRLGRPGLRQRRTLACMGGSPCTACTRGAERNERHGRTGPHPSRSAAVQMCDSGSPLSPCALSPTASQVSPPRLPRAPQSRAAGPCSPCHRSAPPRASLAFPEGRMRHAARRSPLLSPARPPGASGRTICATPARACYRGSVRSW
jgi:hypothetical protein